MSRIVGHPVRLRIPDRFARMILGGGADYFLLSYDIRPSRAPAGGFPSVMPSLARSSTSRNLREWGY
jgi:hypothetical protein